MKPKSILHYLFRDRLEADEDMIPCDTCGGYGALYTGPNYDHSCPDCGGDGWVPMPTEDE